MTGTVEQPVAVVTGAAKGIGRSTAEALDTAEEGTGCSGSGVDGYGRRLVEVAGA